MGRERDYVAGMPVGQFLSLPILCNCNYAKDIYITTSIIEAAAEATTAAEAAAADTAAETAAATAAGAVAPAAAAASFGQLVSVF